MSSLKSGKDIQIANQFIYLLFIYLILVKDFYIFILTFDTFEDVMQPLADELCMIT